MHESVMRFVSSLIPKYALQNKQVLEVGSYDINGTVRPQFVSAGCAYTGIDIMSGKGVDIIMDCHKLEFEDKTFDVVLSLEMLEHDSHFWISLPEMGRVLKVGGHLVLTARGNGFFYHGFPKDYWRFMDDAPEMWGNLAGVRMLEKQSDPQCQGLFFVGVKEY